MHVPPAPQPASRKTVARSKIEPPDPAANALLESLAAAGEALTHALVHRDFEGIAAATRDAEALVDQISRRDPAAPDRRVAPHPALLLLGEQIGATARRNAVLIERAWATDAAILRLLVTAARSQPTDAAASGPYAQPTLDPGQAAGWLNRSA